jgi:hypothetical protein
MISTRVLVANCGGERNWGTSGAGVLQRVAVTIPLAAIAATAARLLRAQLRTPARSGSP